MKKRMTAFSAMAWRLTALVLALWMLAMWLLTWAVAADSQQQIVSKAREYVRLGNSDSREEPGPVEKIRLLGDYYYWMDFEKLLPIQSKLSDSPVSTDHYLWGKWDLYYGFEGAEAFYDENGELLLSSGSYLAFAYTTKDAWTAGNVEPMGYGYLDLDETGPAKQALSEPIAELPCGDPPGGLFSYLLRMTGRFEGERFQPIRIDRGWYFGSAGEVEDPAQFQQVDAQGQVEWEELLNTQTSEEADLVTIYTWGHAGILTEYSKVRVGDETYASLTDLLTAHMAGEGELQKDSLLESIIICRGSRDGMDYALALRHWPLRYACMSLWKLYLISLAVTLLLLRLVLSRMQSGLTGPVSNLAEALEKGRGITPDASWQELRMLEEYFVQSRQAQAEASTELRQLRTALDYARNAEENRRQLISNITHELKTPLAVIHSYAEGLQAGIAEGKREQYLSTILEEAERMDAMVLQMLDLSRLEAGKVRLTMTRFSLLGLTKSVAEKLTPMLEGKELELNYDLAEEFLLTADEGRMEQVVTNLMSNALKYTPAGGRIGVKIYTHKGTARFLIENDCPHLSEEALTKVFDSFYRADPSRTEPGTGLGLTLVKSIVELHGGTCSVRNTTRRSGERTLDCVEFGFSLPMT